MDAPRRIVVLAGGFGGSRMAHGFALLAPEVQLSVIGNTADDLELHGLRISPDLDTIMYTIAGLINESTGWGVRDETWSAAQMLERYGQPVWFGLGDRDLATHIVRTSRLRAGESLSQVTAALAGALGVDAQILPMTDAPVRTRVRTTDGWLPFQDYFVRRRHADEVHEVAFDGVDAAAPTQAVSDAIDAAELIVLAPSNPFVSVAPILAVRGLRQRLAAASAPVVAVSPIVAGAALRGPAAAMMRSLAGQPATSSGIAAHYVRSYPGLIDTLVIDTSDADEAGAVAAAGLTPLVLPTVIATREDRAALARELLPLIPTHV